MRNSAYRFVVAAAISTLSLPALAQPAATPAPKANSCFFSRDFENWKAPDKKTMYIRVGLKDYYRIDMASTCWGLTGVNPHLVTSFRGSDSVCSAIDWDLKVVAGPGDAPQACIVKAMTKLTPEEAAAIPKKFKP